MRPESGHLRADVIGRRWQRDAVALWQGTAVPMWYSVGERACDEIVALAQSGPQRCQWGCGGSWCQFVNRCQASSDAFQRIGKRRRVAIAQQRFGSMLTAASDCLCSQPHSGIPQEPRRVTEVAHEQFSYRCLRIGARGGRTPVAWLALPSTTWFHDLAACPRLRSEVRMRCLRGGT